MYPIFLPFKSYLTLSYIYLFIYYILFIHTSFQTIQILADVAQIQQPSLSFSNRNQTISKIAYCLDQPFHSKYPIPNSQRVSFTLINFLYNLPAPLSSFLSILFLIPLLYHIDLNSSSYCLKTNI